MSRPKWSTLSQETLFSCPYFQLGHDRYVLPRDDQVGEYFYLDIPASTVVVPRLADGTLVLVRQYRYLMRRASLEFPAGGVRRGDDIFATAQQELHEEAGFRAGSWAKLGEMAPCNGLSNEMCHVYLATDLQAVGNAPEATEELEVVHLGSAEVVSMIRSAELWDGMTMAALRMYEAFLAQEGVAP